MRWRTFPIYLEIGDVSRFASPQHLASYPV
jgi:hypothetical protein